MGYVINLFEHVVSTAQSWSPMQLLVIGLITVLLGYLGIVARLAAR